jgi:putative ABC transport system permease protein
LSGLDGHQSDQLGSRARKSKMLPFAWQNLITRPTRTLLAVVGLTIPILAILGLFSLTHGIRTLMGNTLAKMNGLMVMRANSPAPVFSDLPESMLEELRKIPGTRIVAPEVWKICPPIEGRNLLARAATKMLTGKGADRFSSIAETIMIEGQSLPEHLHLKSGVYEQGILPPEEGGGRFLTAEDVGKFNVLISTKIARDYPGEGGVPKKVGDTILIGGKPCTIIGLYETGSLLIDTTVVMEIAAARQLLNEDKSYISTYYVEPDAETDLDVLSERITRAVDDVQARSMSQFNIQVGNIMGKLNLFLLLTVGLALLVGGVGIANTMLMSAMERFVEFGVMRANGWTRRNILGLVTAESALLGVISGLAGAILAFVGVTALNSFLSSYELRLELTTKLVVASIFTAIVIAAVAGIYPAWRASRMTPMDAIRNEAS